MTLPACTRSLNFMGSIGSNASLHSAHRVAKRAMLFVLLLTTIGLSTRIQYAKCSSLFLNPTRHVLHGDLSVENDRRKCAEPQCENLSVTWFLTALTRVLRPALVNFLAARETATPSSLRLLNYLSLFFRPPPSLA